MTPRPRARGEGARPREGIDFERLLAGRLLASTEDGALELAHDSLLDRWERLRELVSGRRDLVRFQTRVAQAAELWDEHRRPRGLLWHGETLEEARVLRRRGERLLRPLDRAFLDASVEAAERGRKLRTRALAVAAVMAAAIAATTLLALRASRRAAHAARVQAIVNAAESASDPMLGVMLLAELAGEEASPRAYAAAYRVADRAYPSRTLAAPVVGATPPSISTRSGMVALPTARGVFPCRRATTASATSPAPRRAAWPPRARWWWS